MMMMAKAFPTKHAEARYIVNIEFLFSGASYPALKALF